MSIQKNTWTHWKFCQFQTDIKISLPIISIVYQLPSKVEYSKGCRNDERCNVPWKLFLFNNCAFSYYEWRPRFLVFSPGLWLTLSYWKGQENLRKWGRLLPPECCVWGHCVIFICRRNLLRKERNTVLCSTGILLGAKKSERKLACMSNNVHEGVTCHREGRNQKFSSP